MSINDDNEHLREYREKFSDRIKFWQKFDDDWRELFTKKVRDNVDFGTELWAALGNVTWYHNDDTNNNECGYSSFRAAGAFISSMLCYGDYIDWYSSTKPGVVSDEIANAMTAKGWRYEIS